VVKAAWLERTQEALHELAERLKASEAARGAAERERDVLQQTIRRVGLAMFMVGNGGKGPEVTEVRQVREVVREPPPGLELTESPAPMLWQVTIVRTEGRALGITLSKKEEPALVKSVSVRGLIADWNASAAHELRVRAGDRVEGVNGERLPAKAVPEVLSRPGEHVLDMRREFAK